MKCVSEYLYSCCSATTTITTAAAADDDDDDDDEYVAFLSGDGSHLTRPSHVFLKHQPSVSSFALSQDSC